MPSWFKIQRIVNDVNHACILFIGLLAAGVACRFDYQNTAMHMFFTVIGFHVLIAEALISHYPINRLTINFSYRNRSRYHGILQLIGGSMVLKGVFEKMRNTEVHFTTWHGRCGFLAAFMCFASLISGILNYFQPKFINKIYRPSELKFRHNLFGLLTFSLGMTTIYLGYFTEFFTKYVQIDGYAISRITLLVSLLTILPPLGSLLHKCIYWRSR